MVNALYLNDCYLNEFEATVESVKEDKFIVLDQTGFYPNSGGQPHDTGKLVCGDQEYNVVYVAKFGDIISHEIDKPGLKPGDKVRGFIDWDRRYKLMRCHTAAHIISGIFNKETGALITGNQLDLDKGRIDFSLEKFDRGLMNDYFKKANELIEQDLPIKIYSMPREEAMKLPEIFKLANVLPPAVNEIRIVEIVGFDRQADGGTHVKSLKEVGRIEFAKAENKGKNNRRVYFGLKT